MHSWEEQMVAFMFPGQGSQQRGMGERLFDEVREYAVVESEVDAIMGYSMRKLCLQDTDNQLTETQYTQPSLYVVNALHYYNAVSKGVRPAYLAGHSLGEYNALLAAGVFDFMTGLKLVKRRGELMARATFGGMAAIVGLSSGRIAQLLRERGITTLEVANYNSSSQTVIAGPVADLQRVAGLFEGAGAELYLQLPVCAAFHSRYLAAAAQSFQEFLGAFQFKRAQLPVIANTTAQPYPAGDPTEVTRSMLVKQITEPVQWMQTVRYLLDRGVLDFLELGPGNVITRLVQQAQRDGMPQNVSIQ